MVWEFLNGYKKINSHVNSIVLLFFLNPMVHAQLTDLEELSQRYVLEAKQIIIPEYPHAFNPSIICWRGSLLMSFRVIPDEKNPFNSWIGLIWLDKDFQPISKPQRLYVRKQDSKIPSRMEDGRLIVIGDQLFIVYSDNEDQVITRGGFRMYIAELHFNGKKFFAERVERLSSFDKKNKDRREKNWVPFDYYGNLLLSYSICPHYVLQPLLSTGHCETFVCSDCPVKWKWGALRGGTPAVLDGDHYLAFFHSSKKMATIHSKGKESLHYFIGAYTFCAKPPFNLLSVSSHPIIGKHFYKGISYKPYWQPVQVVFPCGLIVDEQYIWISYGRQDHEIWIAKLDKNALYESMKNV